MNADAALLATSTAGAVAVIAAYRLVSEWLFSSRARIDARLKQEFDLDCRSPGESPSLFKQLSTQPASGLRRNVWGWLQLGVEQSGLPISPARLLETAVAAALVAGTATALFGPHWVLAIPAAAACFVSPFLLVHFKRRQRTERLTNQLPEAFELMSRAVRAGQTISAAFRLVAAESKPPISEEFSHCCEQLDLGLPQEVAMRELARRNSVMELQMFVVALLVQRQTGGSPVEVLENLSGMVRKRIRMKGKVKALTGEGRMQAVVLSILPVAAFFAMYFLKRSYAQVLLERPLLLLGTAGAAAIGSLWIRKIVNFDF